MSGTVIAQIIMFAMTPILTRFYGPDAFGVLGLFTATVAVCSVIVALRYQLAIVLPKEENGAISVLKLSMIVVLFMTLILCLLIFFLGEIITDLLGISELNTWLWWIPIYVLFMGVYQNLEYFSIRKKAYKRLSISQVTRATSTSGFQLTGSLVSVGPGGLIIGMVVGQVLASVTLALQVFKNEKGLMNKVKKNNDVFNVAREYSMYPKYNTPQALINSFSQTIPIFALTVFFNPAIAGFYTLSHRLLSMPMSLVSDAVRKVYFQKASSQYNKGEKLFDGFLKIMLLMSILGLIPTLIVVFFGPDLFMLFLGENWSYAGVFAQWIIVWLFFDFLRKPCLPIVEIFKWQKQYLNYEIIVILLRVIVLIAGSFYFEPIIAIALFSIVSAIMNLVLIITTIHMLRVKTRTGGNK